MRTSCEKNNCSIHRACSMVSPAVSTSYSFSFCWLQNVEMRLVTAIERSTFGLCVVTAWRAQHSKQLNALRKYSVRFGQIRVGAVNSA